MNVISLLKIWTNNKFGLCFSIGRPKHVRVMAGALEGDMFIGPKAEVCLKNIFLYGNSIPLWLLVLWNLLTSYGQEVSIKGVCLLF